MRKPFRISVVICTYNRCASLADTLESLNAMDVPPAIDWDVLVVDNRSTYATRDVVESAARKSDVAITYLLERQQGQSFARNLGITSTDKEYIAFTDDDVIVPRDWLARIVDAFVENDADCVG